MKTHKLKDKDSLILTGKQLREWKEKIEKPLLAKINSLEFFNNQQEQIIMSTRMDFLEMVNLKKEDYQRYKQRLKLLKKEIKK